MLERLGYLSFDVQEMQESMRRHASYAEVTAGFMGVLGLMVSMVIIELTGWRIYVAPWCIVVAAAILMCAGWMSLRKTRNQGQQNNLRTQSKRGSTRGSPENAAD